MDLVRLRSIEDMEHQWESQQKNREAEESHVRKTVWQSNEGDAVEDDEMRQTVLGDINHPSPIIMQPQQTQSQIASLLTGFAIAAASGLGGYYLANKGSTPTETTDPQPIEFDDETVSVGLGRIEDYLQNNQ